VAVSNFRFNESPLDLLRRATDAGANEITLQRFAAGGGPCGHYGSPAFTCHRSTRRNNSTVHDELTILVALARGDGPTRQTCGSKLSLSALPASAADGPKGEVVVTEFIDADGRTVFA
jgi:hypothetical protein